MFLIIYMAATFLMVFLELFKVVSEGWMVSHYMIFLTIVGAFFILGMVVKYRKTLINH
ncbi:hypothetical protein MNBD_ALPHA01-1902 [hydrothermal vent metagenome]|uniref:Uncharacterized protein n=1 Tax=hydrothermal vent metagenome TaxID=652676 RepID=A0A3B0TDK9_9ZZZZ